MNSDIERGGFGGGRVRRAPAAGVIALVAGVLAAAGESVRADWAPAYSIERVGLYGPLFASSGGLPNRFVGSPVRGVLIGTAWATTLSGQDGGQHAWMWSASTGTVAVGPDSGEYVTASGYRFVAGLAQGTNGWIWGTSSRVSGPNGRGADGWVRSPEGVTTIVGLRGTVFATADGSRTSSVRGMLASQPVAFGTSRRFTAAGIENGQDIWWWSPSSGTQPLGLNGPEVTGSEGYRVSVASGYGSSIVGTTERITGARTNNGREQWRWSPDGGLVVLGLSGPQYTSPTGYRYTGLDYSSDDLIAGTTTQYLAPTSVAGSEAWTWTPTAGTVRIGLVDARHTYPNGKRVDQILLVDPSGVVVGQSERYTDEIGFFSGNEAWVWTAAGGTIPVGLQGPAYGREDAFMGSRGQAVSGGYVAGITTRVTGAIGSLGADAWRWSASTGTVPIGPSGGIYQSSSGVQQAEVARIARDGTTFGNSAYFAPSGARIGFHQWCWSPEGGTVILGLRDSEHTGTNGVQNSEVSVVGESGASAGTSTRYTATGAENGRSAFYFDRNRGVQQIGLQDPMYTGTGGYRRQTLSTLSTLEPSGRRSMIDLTGRVFGSTDRITDERTSAGADLWMFDPQTGVTTRITPAVPSAVSQDGRARATITTVTEDGYILGNYDSYAESSTTAQSRAFVYRADLGFTDLGAITLADPASAGFARLYLPQALRAGELIYGSGQMTVASATSAFGTFVMRPIPAPVCPADVTGDRTVDGADFIAFINSFSLGDAAIDAAADFNRDGTIDGGDFVAYMAAFAAGC